MLRICKLMTIHLINHDTLLPLHIGVSVLVSVSAMLAVLIMDQHQNL